MFRQFLAQAQTPEAVTAVLDEADLLHPTESGNQQA